MTNTVKIYSTPPATTNQQLDFILLDGSASMRGRWWDALAAIDKYVGTLATQGVDSTITLVTFGNSGEYHLDRTDTPKSWQSCVAQSPGFWDTGTALYDSINRLIRDAQKQNPSKCAITIVTDGDENASHHTNLDQVRTLLDWARSRGWQITFLGCDFDNTAMAKLLGAGEGSALGTSARRLSDAAMELAKKRAHHSKFGTPMHFTEEERKRFGGYLTHTPTT